VLINASNDVFYQMLSLAIIGCGAIMAGSNPGYTSFELTHHIKATDATWIMTEPETLSTVLTATKAVSIPNSRIIIFHPLSTQQCPPGFKSWTTLFNHGTSDWVRFDSYTTCKTTTAARFTSSGTSGLPKATVNTHLNLIAQHEYNYSPSVYHKPYTASHIFTLPMFHAAVSPRSMTTAWKVGETCYVMRRFEPSVFINAVATHRITELYLVPPLVIALIMHPLSQRTPSPLRSVRSGWVGAAPLTRETQARLTRLLAPDAKFTQVWGMTEANCFAARFPEGEDDTTGSVGYLCPGMEGKLVDPDTGKDISAYGVRGEMCVRGESVIPGYYNAPAANAKSWDKDGFYHSGDVMYADASTHKLYVVDRVKELIKVRGFQVAPPEIESLLLEIPGVVDAAVIGVRAADGEGEACRAYVVTRPGLPAAQIPTEKDVYDYVKDKLIRYKHLDGGVAFVPLIPKTASGKILKRLLREEFERESRVGGGAASKL
jgi:acyl-CoA synthetase (AMP-forming)/AMP-acid ligase II